MPVKIKRPVLRYHGGKYKLAPWIISNFPAHRIYTEVFGGAASVLMQKPRSYAEVYNDVWGTVVNVFQVLRDPESAKELKRLLELTPYSREEYELTVANNVENIVDPLEKARLTIFRSFAGFGSAATNGSYNTGFRATSYRSYTTPSHDWASYTKHIDTFTERLKGVTIENRHYIDVLHAHDSAETLHYVDPPYVHSTRNLNNGTHAYAHEMTDWDHMELGNVLNGLKGNCVVSGYDCGLYRWMFKDWQVVSKKAFADGAKERTEMLWIRE